MLTKVVEAVLSCGVSPTSDNNYEINLADGCPRDVSISEKKICSILRIGYTLMIYVLSIPEAR